MTRVGYQMFVSDIDGTLVAADGRASPTDRAAIRRLSELGVSVVLATGRSWGATRYLWEDLGLASPVILLNGAHVFDPVSGRYLGDRRLSREEVEETARLLDGRGFELVAVFPDRILYPTDAFRARRYLIRGDDAFEEVPDLFEALRSEPETPTKMLLLGEPDLLAAARAILDRSGVVSYVLSDQYCIDIMPAGVSKGTALRLLLDETGLTPSEVVAIGNAPNDIEMLRLAGFSVAVQDAHPAVLSVADAIAVPHDRNAVAWAIACAFSPRLIEAAL